MLIWPDLTITKYQMPKSTEHVTKVKLPEEVSDLVNDSTSVKIIATTDEGGTPHVSFVDSLSLLDDGNLAFAEAFEGSQTNINLVRSLWFDKDVGLAVKGKNGVTFQIIGRLYKYSYTGPLFKRFYESARQKWGSDSDVAGVWIIRPQEVKNEILAVKKKEEDEKHPFFRHFDRESVRNKAITDK